MAPMIPGVGMLQPERRHLLACLGGQRRLRSVRGGPDLERWVRANARRWFVVRAASVRAARQQLTEYLDHVSRLPAGAPTTPGAYGVIDAGRNAAGGPREFPRADGRAFTRPSPSASAGRRSRARPPDRRGGPHPLIRTR